jgi:hypothetical protein
MTQHKIHAFLVRTLSPTKNSALIIIILTAISCSGCSVNGFGIPGSVDEQTIATKTSKVVITKAKGLHLYTRESFGLHLGYIERVLIYPIVSNNGLLCADKLLGNAKVKDDKVTPLPVYWDDAIVVNNHAYGIGFSLSGHSLDLIIGIKNSKALSVQSSDTFSIFYSDKEAQKGLQVCALIQPQPEGLNHEN